jgi:hypothetical protein
MCSVIVHFLHCICVCDCDGRRESLIVLSRSVMVRHSHLLARCYLGTMCMCTIHFTQQDCLFGVCSTGREARRDGPSRSPLVPMEAVESGGSPGRLGSPRQQVPAR